MCTRAEIFITTKIVPWSSNQKSDIEDSLKKLGVDYIDLCLLHQSGGNASDDKVYKEMIESQKKGKIRSIGISNFYTEKAVRHFFDFEIKPAVVQNENHIFNQEEELKSFCQKNNIYIESYYPFGGRGNTKEHLENPVIQKIAKAHGKTSAQVLVRWHLQSGFIAIPGSSNPKHIL
ncbi:MAG: aldo/keto reductase [Treponema sp.]|nr:aldo/keto reductase [Candidatus Treponema equifaecale]